MGFEIINKLKEEKGRTNAQLAQMSGVTLSTLDKITAGINTNPKLDTLQAICRALDCRLDDFDDAPIKNAPSQRDEADEIADVYRKLDDHGKGAVKAILHFEHAAIVAEKRQLPATIRPGIKARKRSDGFIDMNVYDQPSAAGLGNYLDDPSFHVEQYPANEVPEGTEFGVKISGHSMEPNIPDGCTVFVQSRSTIEPGKIGIFLLNGEARCKKLMVDRGKNQIRLVSFNPAFEDRIIEECDDFRTMALVLGWWPK